MTETRELSCHPAVQANAARTVGLSVLPSRPNTVRKSRISKWRAVSLVTIHVLMILHVVHWLRAGRTLSPVEPSEAMYTLNYGHLNAGFLFFATAILATLVLGRFVCGWGCHFIAYQDLCAWLLRRIGIRPKPLRARLLVFAPLALALYMFVWPTAYRFAFGYPAPPLENHLMKSEFWETFPGPFVAVLTVLVAGFAIVYFLGSKGFCTYACPYGGFFGLVDKFAPGRIRVTDDCEHCGHCTSACTSNVRVHEEVAQYGMVVDPGCMKCMDCISVCPNDALYFGFGKPAVNAARQVSNRRSSASSEANSPQTRAAGFSPRDASTARNSQRPLDAPHTNRPLFKRGSKEGAAAGVPQTRNGKTPVTLTRHRSIPYDFTLSEELAMVVIGVAALLAFRGLYDQIPLLMAMAMAAVTAFVALKSFHAIRRPNVRWQNLQLKRGNKLTAAGIAFVAASIVLFAFAGHSGLVQYNAWRGHTLFARAAIPDSVWFAGDTWWHNASAGTRDRMNSAIAHLERADRLGFLSTHGVLQDLTWFYLARGADARAEQILRRITGLSPKLPDAHRGLGGVLRKMGRFADAEASFRRALDIDPYFDPARTALCDMLLDLGRTDDALAVFRAAPTSPTTGASYSYSVAHAAESASNAPWTLAYVDRLMRQNRFAPAKLALEYLLDDAGSPTRAAGFSPRDVPPAELRGVSSPDATTASDAGNQTPDPQTNASAQRSPLSGGTTEEAAHRPYDLAGLHWRLGVTMLALNQPDQGIDHLQLAVRHRPDFPEANYDLGMTLLTAGNLGAALPHLEAAAKDPDHFPLAHYNLGVALYMSGRPADALPHVRNALRLQPSDPQAQAFLAELLRSVSDEP